MKTKASMKGFVILRIVDAKHLEIFFLRVSNSEHLDDRQKQKAREYAKLLTESLSAACSRVSLPTQVVLAALQCLALSLRHSNSITKWVEKLLGDE